ncbi:MAG: protein-L-isoaspartate O-methyltransferase [Acidimicrobiales bacterium]|nr:protein-L-isoaspartate O-methyltransferase [Hyphomonadaceae bacterium]RZV36507.1 MAG: protein-L-isoaspartate O-methyltransferase [Acidimicrobiales bacterium]
MFDYNAARETMLDCQIRTSDVTDFAVQAAFKAVPREKFVPKSKMALAYGDANVDLGDGRWMMKPRDFAKMVDAADIEPTDVVLNIACDRGYSVAVLAHLAETVVALESAPELADKATAQLEQCDITNAAIVTGDLKAGAREHGPFDVIFVNGAVSEISPSWVDQLAGGGRIVVPISSGHVCRVHVYTKSGDTLGERVVFDAGIPTIPGFEKEPEFAL